MILRNRPRRLRQNPQIRKLSAENHIHSSDLVYPIFITSGDSKRDCQHAPYTPFKYYRYYTTND